MNASERSDVNGLHCVLLLMDYFGIFLLHPKGAQTVGLGVGGVVVGQPIDPDLYSTRLFTCQGIGICIPRVSDLHQKKVAIL